MMPWAGSAPLEGSTAMPEAVAQPGAGRGRRSRCGPWPGDFRGRPRGSWARLARRAWPDRSPLGDPRPAGPAARFDLGGEVRWASRWGHTRTALRPGLLHPSARRCLVGGFLFCFFFFLGVGFFFACCLVAGVLFFFFFFFFFYFLLSCSVFFFFVVCLSLFFSLCLRLLFVLLFFFFLCGAPFFLVFFVVFFGRGGLCVVSRWGVGGFAWFFLFTWVCSFCFFVCVFFFIFFVGGRGRWGVSGGAVCAAGV